MTLPRRLFVSPSFRHIIALLYYAVYICKVCKQDIMRYGVVASIGRSQAEH
jgi:hypothetical protein